jgi:hypothetical protein
VHNPPSRCELCRKERVDHPRRRGIQYAAASRFDHERLGLLNHQVKPGDDGCEGGASRTHFSNGQDRHMWTARHEFTASRRQAPEPCQEFSDPPSSAAAGQELAVAAEGYAM